MKRIFGFKPQPIDTRDNIFSWCVPKKELPTMVDLRSKMPRVYDQGSLGSSTANAIAALIECKSKMVMPSRLFVYFNGRLMLGTQKEDSGATLRDTLKSVSKNGVCEEKMLPYLVTKFDQQPSTVCYDSALQFTATQYTAVPQIENSLKTALIAGLPVAFGFQVKKSFLEVEEDGIYKPKANEQLVGGHAAAIVGYDDTLKMFIVRNSFGKKWGNKGYFMMPYKEVLDPNVSTDFWVIQAMSK